MRRMPEPIEPSYVIKNAPIWPVCRTWVPPQSSRLSKHGDADAAHYGTVFLAEEGHCTFGDGLIVVHLDGFDGIVALICSLTMRSTRVSSS